mgnify:CR=1 FL=1
MNFIKCYKYIFFSILFISCEYKNEYINKTKYYINNEFQNISNLSLDESINKLSELREMSLIINDYDLFINLSLEYFLKLSLIGSKTKSRSELINIFIIYDDKISDYSKINLYLAIISVYFQEYNKRYLETSEYYKYFFNLAKNIVV